MAGLEWEQAAIGANDFTRHPYTIAVDRIAAARWLNASGDPGQALRLLTFVDGPFLLHPSTPYSVSLMRVVQTERSRIK